MRAKIGSLAWIDLALVVAVILVPGVVALLALAGEPWRMLDRPLYTGQLGGARRPLSGGGFTLTLGRGFLASVVFAAGFAALGAAGLSRRRAPGRAVAAGGGIMGAAAVVLFPLTHAFWLADAVDTSRLHFPIEERGVFLDLLAMTASEWAQAAPYVLVSLYAIAALVTVLMLVGVHAEERSRLTDDTFDAIDPDRYDEIPVR